jgi:hypothetical protein
VKRLWCRIVGHDLIPVREVGLTARPGGMLPMLDGFVTYAPDPSGEDRACTRCREVTHPTTTEPEGGER